jgi:uncharacterized membrane protein
MKKKSNPFVTTALGGLIFLVPFVVVLVIVAKAFSIMQQVAEPVARAIEVDHIGVIAMIDLLAVVFLVSLCWLAGLVALSRRGRALYEAFDEKLLDLFPRYGFVKSMTESMSADTKPMTLPVVLVRLDDQSQVAFEVERTESQVVVFLPGSPDPWSGTVSLVTPDRVQHLDVDFKTAVKSIRLAGRGTLKFATPGRAG